MVSVHIWNEYRLSSAEFMNFKLHKKIYCDHLLGQSIVTFLLWYIIAIHTFIAVKDCYENISGFQRS